MNFSSPKITILLATYNRAHLILETLESIASQTYSNFECLITDDNSTDNTKQVVSGFCNTDSRFLYFKKPDSYFQGLSDTRNYGLDLAAEREANFIHLFDDDDIMHPQKLELQIAQFINNPSLQLTICQYRKFVELETIELDLSKADDHLCNVITENLLKDFYLNNINLNSLGPLWQASILLKYRFNKELFYAEEREFYLRIFLNETLKYKPVPLVLFWYRKHDQSITKNLYEDPSIKQKSQDQFEEVFFHEILKQKKAPFFLLKAYVKKGFKYKNKFYTSPIVKYIVKQGLFTKPKYFGLLVYIKVKSI